MKNQKGFALDPIYIGLTFTVAVIIFVILAAIWVPFRTQIDANNSNLNATDIASINGLGNLYFLNSGSSFLLLFYGVMVIGLFVTAFLEASTPVALALFILLLIPMLFVSFMLSDVAHAILTSPALGTITANYYSGILYIEDNLPIITFILAVVYIVLVMLHKQQPGGAAYAGRFSQG